MPERSSATKINDLRRAINEAVRVQRGGNAPVEYVDVANALAAMESKQNHVIFGRRGTGKTLLLENTAANKPSKTEIIYVDCEEFKTHSFPNVLIEILDYVFGQIDKNLSAWFGRKKKLKDAIRKTRAQLAEFKKSPDDFEERLRETRESKADGSVQLDLIPHMGAKASAAEKTVIEREYSRADSKLAKLNLLLPQLKEQLREFFELSNNVQAIYIEIDDFYQLKRLHQPMVLDFIHRLCKGIPLFFKIATLRHATIMFIDRDGQPFGAQERHDYQPLNVDFNLSNLKQTKIQLRQILQRVGARAGWTPEQLDSLFKGEGFERLVLAAGGVPRDFLSLLLDFNLKPGSIGKDEVRIVSQHNTQRRIQELRQDSEGAIQAVLLRAIYAIQEYCLNKRTNVFLVAEETFQKEDRIRQLFNRLLDYRLVHLVAPTITSKSHQGAFQAFMIDIGFYAQFRKLKTRQDGKMKVKVEEVAIADKERMRGAPVLNASDLQGIFAKVKDADLATFTAMVENPDQDDDD